MERAEDVVDEARLAGELRAAHAPARLARGLEDQHVPATVGEQVGGHEAVRPRPDDDRVGHVCHVSCRSGQNTTSWRRANWTSGAPSSAIPCGAVIVFARISTTASRSVHGLWWMSPAKTRPASSTV